MYLSPCQPQGRFTQMENCAVDFQDMHMQVIWYVDPIYATGKHCLHPLLLGVISAV